MNTWDSEGRFLVNVKTDGSDTGTPTPDPESSTVCTLTGETTDAVPITLDGSCTVATNSAFAFSILLIATEEATGATHGFEFKGVIRNLNGTTELVGMVTGGDLTPPLWAATVAADDVNDALVVMVTGEAGKTITWKGKVIKASTVDIQATVDDTGMYYVLEASTVDDTPTAMDDRIPIPIGNAVVFNALIIAIDEDTGDAHGFEFKGTIRNVSGVTTIVGSVVGGDLSPPLWSVEVTADDANDALVFNVTGEVGKNISWRAKVLTVSVGEGESASIDSGVYHLTGQTTDENPVDLVDAVPVPMDNSFTFTVLIVAVDSATGDTHGFRYDGTIKNVSGVTSLVGMATGGDLTPPLWSVDISADDTNDTLQISVTGESGKTINWAARVTIVSVGDALPAVPDTGTYYMAGQTTDDTPLELETAIPILLDTSMTFDVLVIAVDQVSGDSHGFKFEGVISNVGGTVSIVGMIVGGALTSTTWDVNVAADDTDDELIVTVTGESGKTINWKARVTTVSV